MKNCVVSIIVLMSNLLAAGCSHATVSSHQSSHPTKLFFMDPHTRAEIKFFSDRQRRAYTCYFDSQFQDVRVYVFGEGYSKRARAGQLKEALVFLSTELGVRDPSSVLWLTSNTGCAVLSDERIACVTVLLPEACEMIGSRFSSQ